MKYTIRHICGHTETVQIFGSSRERENRERWLSQQVCIECRRRQQQQAAQVVTEKYALPPLEGSEKQKTWAISIRAEWLRRMIEAAGRYGEKAAAVREALIEAAAQQRSAAWWIDNRMDLNTALAPIYEEALRKKITE